MIRRAEFPAKHTAPIATGIAGRPVPIEQLGSARSTPRTVAAQLAQPFKVRSATDGQ
jgi:hypothetical protein